MQIEMLVLTQNVIPIQKLIFPDGMIIICFGDGETAYNLINEEFINKVCFI